MSLRSISALPASRRRGFFISRGRVTTGIDKTHKKHNPKGEKDNEGKVINRLWVVNSQVEEKGRGKEKVPLDPL